MCSLLNEGRGSALFAAAAAFLAGFVFPCSAGFAKADRWGSAFQQDKELRSLLRSDVPTVIVPYSLSFFEADPMEAILARNLWIMNLLYEKLLKPDKDGFLVSEVLEKFSYDDQRGEILLEVKKNKEFHDGSPITADDLKMVIMRAALLKPGWHLTGKIVGVRKWRTSEAYPLQGCPEGLATPDRWTLKIRLTERIGRPLEQLAAANLLLLIPAKSIDKKTGKILGGIPPFSGKYRIEEKIGERLIVFKSNAPSDKPIPETIRLIHIPTNQLIRYIDDFRDRHIIIAEHFFIPRDHLKILMQKMKMRILPETRVMALRLNHRAPPFDQLRARQYFAREFRKTVHDFFGASDGSLLTRLVVGYVPLKELEALIPPFTPSEERQILEKFRKHPLRYTSYFTAASDDPFKFYMSRMMARLGLDVQKSLKVSSDRERLEMWARGDLNVGRFYTSFNFNYDDLEDSLYCLFAKDMFSNAIDQSDDQRLAEIVQSFRSTGNGSSGSNVTKFKELNRHLFVQSRLAVVANYSYLYFNNKSSKLELINDYTDTLSDLFTL